MAGGFGDSDPFGSVVRGMLEGAQIRAQLQQSTREQQAFQTKQVLDNHNRSVQDIMDGMNLQPVTNQVGPNGVAVPSSTSITRTPTGGDASLAQSLAAAPPSAENTMAQLQNLPATQTSINTTPASTRAPRPQDLRTVPSSVQGGAPQQFELKNRDELNSAADDAALRARTSKAADYSADETAKANALEQAHARANDYQLQSEGGGIQAPPEFAALGVPQKKADGTPVMLTRAQVQAGTEAIAKLNEQNATTRKTAADAAKLEQENKFLQDLKPQEIHAAVDQTVPADTPDHIALNQRTHTAVNTALLMGDKKAAIAALKDAGDQLGRTETAVATAKGTAQTKISINTTEAANKSAASGMTEDDYQREGQKYALTGVMPPLGMQAGGRQKILHYANEFARQNGFSPKDLATMQASFAGDKDSLKKFQSQRDQIVSFEQTASKNLDNFIGLASKIPDSGSPWLNLPMRQLTKNLVGSDAMAAVDAARQVANNEIAKVTAGGGLSGVVSDSARKEIESFNPQNATLKQTLAVAKVLKADMANRHQSMDATLGEIKSRMGTSSAPDSAPPAGGGRGVGGAPGANAGGLPTISDQAAYDKLPKGAQYLHDGKVLTKQ